MKVLVKILMFPVALVKTIYMNIRGITCAKCSIHTRDFFVDSTGREYCRNCWRNQNS